MPKLKQKKAEAEAPAAAQTPEQTAEGVTADTDLTSELTQHQPVAVDHEPDAGHTPQPPPLEVTPQSIGSGEPQETLRLLINCVDFAIKTREPLSMKDRTIFTLRSERGKRLLAQSITP